jgi:hypothetical protein
MKYVKMSFGNCASVSNYNLNYLDVQDEGFCGFYFRPHQDCDEIIYIL